jgi:hypothetical protein
MRNYHEKSSELFFGLTIVLYILYMLCMQSHWLLSGEMWAEMATNYYTNAIANSYMQKLLATDAGYLPMPQRLIALIAYYLHFPAAAIPYFYTWSALILSAGMVGIFCLPRFRQVIYSDWLRFFMGLAVLLLSDFETKTFINFTYFSAYLITIVTALAWVNRVDNIPKWAWFLPLLMLSKPALLSALPAMIIVSIWSKPRFRLITLITLIVSLLQIIRLVMSQHAGEMPYRTHDISLLGQIWVSCKYFVGFLGGYLNGPHYYFSKTNCMLFGVFYVIIGIVLFYIKTSRSRVLLLLGMSLLFFNILLNSVAFSDLWNNDFARLEGLPIYRHMCVGMIGCIFFLASFLATIFDREPYIKRNIWLTNLSAIIFLVWFIKSGWLVIAGLVNQEPPSPILNNSQWQKMAYEIDHSNTPICVPLDPLVWLYSRDCKFLSSMPNWNNAVKVLDNKLSYKIDVPKALLNNQLISAALLVKPLSNITNFIDVKMELELIDNKKKYYTGSRNLTPVGGMVLLSGKPEISFNQIKSITLYFNIPVLIALSIDDPSGIIWMGR